MVRLILRGDAKQIVVFGFTWESSNGGWWAGNELEMPRGENALAESEKAAAEGFTQQVYRQFLEANKSSDVGNWFDE